MVVTHFLVSTLPSADIAITSSCGEHCSDNQHFFSNVAVKVAASRDVSLAKAPIFGNRWRDTSLHNVSHATLVPCAMD